MNSKKKKPCLRVVFPDDKYKALTEFMTSIEHIRNVRHVLDT